MFRLPLCLTLFVSLVPAAAFADQDPLAHVLDQGVALYDSVGGSLKAAATEMRTARNGDARCVSSVRKQARELRRLANARLEYLGYAVDAGSLEMSNHEIEVLAYYQRTAALMPNRARACSAD
jgi:hypothetical protein